MTAKTAKKADRARQTASPRSKPIATKRDASTGVRRRAPAATKKAASKTRIVAAGKKPTTATVARKRVAATGSKKAVATATGIKRTVATATGSNRTVATARTPTSQRQPRRAIYIDVENTSSEAALLSVIDSLKIDRQKQSVELSAVGNWRTVGQQVGRDLASLGARLIHSAPARGVRDWSDLWIAVAAGGWIALAQPGDILEIVSDDRAFDAVGDAAAAQGVVYQRISHRRSAAAAVVAEKDEGNPIERPRSGRRRRSRRTTKAAATTTATSTPASRPASTGDDPHGASHDQLIEMVLQLSDGRSSPWVNLDVLEGALKRQGFARPANSPRLVTRLRRFKDFEVDAHGRVRIISPEMTDG